MNKSKRERIILGLLLAVLLFAGWNLWQRLSPEPGAPVAGRTELEQPLDTEQFESLDITPEWMAVFDQREDAGRDPFQYGATASPRPSAPPPSPPEETFIRPAAPVRPAAPPPPPPLPLQFVGFSRVGGPDAELRAVLMGDDGLPYPALRGETVMGRYRLQEVTEGFVVVEDLETGRRERLSVNLQQ